MSIAAITYDELFGLLKLIVDIACPLYNHVQIGLKADNLGSIDLAQMMSGRSITSLYEVYAHREDYVDCQTVMRAV